MPVSPQILFRNNAKRRETKSGSHAFCLFRKLCFVTLFRYVSHQTVLLRAMVKTTIVNYIVKTTLKNLFVKGNNDYVVNNSLHYNILNK